MEEQKNETMETEDKEAGADTAADLEETVQQGADGQRMGRKRRTLKQMSPKTQKNRVKTPGQYRRYIRQEPDTVSEASSFSKMNLRSPKKCTWNL